MVGTLSMRCAVMWRCWSWSNQSRGSPPPPWHEVYPPAGLVDGLRRYGGPVLQPVTQRRRGELALVAEGHWGDK